MAMTERDRIIALKQRIKARKELEAGKQATVNNAPKTAESVPTPENRNNA